MLKSYVSPDHSHLFLSFTSSIITACIWRVKAFKVQPRLGFRLKAPYNWPNASKVGTRGKVEAWYVIRPGRCVHSAEER